MRYSRLPKAHGEAAVDWALIVIRGGLCDTWRILAPQRELKDVASSACASIRDCHCLLAGCRTIPGHNGCVRASFLAVALRVFFV